MRFPPRRLFRSRKFVLGAAALLLVVAAGVGAWLLWGPSGEDDPVAIESTVSRETVKSTVAVSGTLAAASAADLDFEVSGTVTAVLVEEGDTVRKGQVLARIGSGSLSSAVDAAESAVDAASTQYDEVSSATSDSVQVAAAQAALVTARDDLAAAEADLAAASLRSTIAGTVTSLDLAVGDVVGTSGGSSAASASTPTGTSTSTSAVRVVKPGRFVVEVTVPAAQIFDVVTSQQATLTVSGVDETVFGTVTDVGRVAQTDTSGAAVFPVTLTVTGKRTDLYAGSSVSADIVTEQRSDVLVVPTQALRTDDDGALYVTLRAGDGTARQEVTTGETYGTSTEVLEGLEEGDVVVLAEFRSPRGGDRGGDDQEQQGGFPGGMTPPEGGFPGGGSAPSFSGGPMGGGQ